MEFLLVLLVLGAVFFVVVTVAVVKRMDTMDKRHERSRAEMTARADEILNGLFDGRPVVTYTASKATLAREAVIEGGGVRGYLLNTETPTPNSPIDERSLVFTRTAS